MTLAEIIDEYGKVGLIGLMALLSLVEVSKIKINPWSWLFAWVGDKLMAGVKKDVAELKSDIAGVKNDVGALRDEHRQDGALAARTRILRFADEVYQQEQHSKEYFDEILRDITAYNHYCDTHKNFENEQALRAIARIEKVYDKCLETGTFL